ncbi:exonuclease domain-containing protein [Arthrobacter crystallopoietes]|uniref:exonuclease domain-containing protein n=1 Tax=Crystallibacter crystallopoietes TaxID=37928 RepID=UPI0011113158|nr:exonuclease domain-containing protein [Arthrobacter crystallopoietes]
MSEPMFAVVDVETTGFHPGQHHRVAEIAVVRVDASGRIIDRWETLINPGRDLGPQSVHRIRAADILDAPTFQDAAPEIAEVLRGTIMVAHNLRFDAGFLEHEFHRAGMPVPASFVSGLCTMGLAHDYVYGNARSLAHCCEFLSIDTGTAHCAGDDAMAAAGLLGRYIDMDPDRPDWEKALLNATLADWSGFPPSSGSFAPVLRPTGNRVEKHFLSRITAHMPEFTGPAEHDQYLDLLDKAMFDLHLSATEQRELVTLADELGISQERCLELHRYYLDQLLGAAWADGQITAGEEQDLRQAAALLGLPEELVTAGLVTPPQITAPVPSRNVYRPEPGDVIVLTGTMSRQKSDIASFLEAMGYTVADNVTKKTNIVVAADPDSLSGKAAKARKYGIPLAGEHYLYDVIGVPAL